MKRRDLLSLSGLLLTPLLRRPPKPKTPAATLSLRLRPHPKPFCIEGGPLRREWADEQGRRWHAVYDHDTGELVALQRGLICAGCGHYLSSSGFLVPMPNTVPFALGPFPAPALCLRCAADIDERRADITGACAECGKAVGGTSYCVCGWGQKGPTYLHPLCYEHREWREAKERLILHRDPEPVLKIMARRKGAFRARWAREDADTGGPT